MPARDVAGAHCFADVESAAVQGALEGQGLVLDLGALSVSVRSAVPGLAGPLHTLYHHFPFIPFGRCFVDAKVELIRSPGIAGYLRPSLRFLADGLDPFGALPWDMPVPQLEWGINWCFATMSNRHLMLHAGTLDVAGNGLLLVGEPGAGKSTLTAAMMLRGARALSDEFGIVRLADRMLLPLTKPIALKNRSIDVIRAWSSGAVLGPTYRKTHKGDVAHLAMPEQAVVGRRTPVVPRLIVFPRWRDGAPLTIEPVGPAEAFGILAFNSFNFDTLGPDAFDAVTALVRSCELVRLRYGNLDEATAALERLAR